MISTHLNVGHLQIAPSQCFLEAQAIRGTSILSSLGWLTGVLQPVIGFLATNYLLGSVCPLTSIPDTACTLTCQEMQLDSEVALVALTGTDSERA